MAKYRHIVFDVDGAVDALEAIYRKWDAGRDVES